MSPFRKNLLKYKRQIEFIADKLGDKGVVDLEQLTTAYFVNLEYPRCDANARANAVVDLKPHISIETARQAVREVDGFVEQVRQGDLVAA